MFNLEPVTSFVVHKDPNLIRAIWPAFIHKAVCWTLIQIYGFYTIQHYST